MSYAREFIDFIDSSSSELLIWYNKDHIKSNSELGVGKVNMYGLTLVVELKSSTLFFYCQVHIWCLYHFFDMCNGA